MPVTIKKSQLMYKNPSTGEYVSVDAVADKTSQQQINGINTAASNAIASINTAMQDIDTQPLTTLPKKAYKKDLVANEETLASAATHAYAVGDYFFVADNNNDISLYKATAAIAVGATISPGTGIDNNCVPAALADDVTSLSNDIDTVKADFNTLKVISIPTTWIENKYVNSIGGLSPFTPTTVKYYASEDIDIAVYSKLSFSGVMYYAFLNSAGAVISGSVGGEVSTTLKQYTVDVPSGAVYFRYTKETLTNANADYIIVGCLKTELIQQNASGVAYTINRIQENKLSIDEKFTALSNVFDYTRTEDGYYAANGSVLNPENMGGCRTDYISVTAGDVVHFTQFSAFTTAMKGGMFNANKEWVNPVATSVATITVSGNEMYFTVPNGVAYIRLNLTKARRESAMLVINTAYPSVYIPYGYTLSDIVYENPENRDYGYLLGSFRKIGAVGDSLASGECVSNNLPSGNNHDLYEHSWLQYMARYYGFTGINFSAGGLSTTTWLTANAGLPKAQTAGNECNCYIIGLGANDILVSEETHLGTTSDIGTDNDTVYGNYSKIVRELKTIQPKAKFFLLTLSYKYTRTPQYADYALAINDAIRYIGNLYENCYVIDTEEDKFFYSDDVTGNYRVGHYNAIGYNMIAMHLAKLIGAYIHNHQEEFRQIEFIGTQWEHV